MIAKSAYLLKKGMIVDASVAEGIYDHGRHLNVVPTTGETLVESNGLAPTQSKTAAAPGDDDPEGIQKLCY